MIGFSNRAFNVIEGFAANMEIPHIAPANDGSVTFDFERAGTFSFTPSQDGSRALLSLKRARMNSQVDDLTRFLALSRWDSHLGLPVSAGMSADGGLVLVASIDEPDLNVQTVEQCLDRLIALHDMWSAG